MSTSQASALSYSEIGIHSYNDMHPIFCHQNTQYKGFVNGYISQGYASSFCAAYPCGAGGSSVLSTLSGASWGIISLFSFAVHMLYSLAGSNAFLLRLSQNPHANADNSSTPSGTPTAAPTVAVEAPVVEHQAGFETDGEDVDAGAIDEVGTEVAELELDALEETTRFPVIFTSFGPPTSKLK